MTTSMISSVLPVAPSNKNVPPAGGHDAPDTTNPSFSSVLTSQQTPSPAPEAGASAQVPAKTDVAHHDERSDPLSEVTENTDAELAQLAGEHGLSLPQIALNIASEAALAMAARQPAAARQPVAASTAQASLAANVITQADHELPLSAAIRPAATTHAANVVPNTSQHALLQQTTPATLDTRQPGLAKAAPLPAGFTPVLAAAAPHQTELNNARKPGLNASASARPILADVQDQARTGSASLGRPSVALSSATASLADKAGMPNTAQIDIGTAQASSAASGLAAAHTAQQAGSMATAFSVSTPAATPAIATPLQNPQWASDFGRQFISLAQGGQNMPHTAELRLDPPELGPLRITINISDNTAHAIFTSPHAAVRQTVENALPQLQQLLEQAGISLGQTSVNDQGQQGQSFGESSSGSRGQTAAAGNGHNATSPDAQQPATRNRAPDALVDTFA
ncbi:flagellar hook-length control protein FliK [Alcaligenaceae bacterium]|nr:flagellar hook-length control protein FliK [Alcaligenaceae bacterium]